MKYQRIVLVDDNDDDNLFHSIMIKRAGFAGELRVFETGAAALAYLDGADLSIPTLVFVDINMPGLSGFQVADKMARYSRASTTLLTVMLTSSAALEDLRRAKSQETIDGYITKPLTAQIVSDLLKEHEWPYAVAEERIF